MSPEPVVTARSGSGGSFVPQWRSPQDMAASCFRSGGCGDGPLQAVLCRQLGILWLAFLAQASRDIRSQGSLLPLPGFPLD